ncbi:MAG: anti-sigma factor family protein [Armatimonadota bacterium]
MSCQNIIPKLSSYMDGEVRDLDALQIKEHADSCESCNRRLLQIQKTAEIIGSVNEIEPPNYLLQQIRAKTVERQTSGSVLLARIGLLFKTPQYVSMAVGATAFAVIAVMMLITGSSQQQIIDKSTAAISNPPMNIVAAVKESAHSNNVAAVITEPESKSVKDIRDYKRNAVHPGSHLRASHYPKINNWTSTPVKSINSAKTDIKNIKNAKITASADTKLVVDGSSQSKVKTVDDSVSVNQPIISMYQKEDKQTTVVADQPKPVESGVQITRELTAEREMRLDQESSALDDMRGKLAVRNRQRQTNNYYSTEHRDFKTISVEIASLSF